MGKSKIAKRTEFFERGVSAFQRITGTAEELYYCPICEQPFDRGALDDGRLTLEHIPSRALKGREILLTCHTCNHTSGHTLDAAADQRNDLWELTEALHGRRGQFQGRATVEIGGHSLTADIDTSDGQIKLVPLSEQSDPASYEKGIQYWKEHSKSRDLKFQLKPRVRLHVRRTKVADLRTGYLAAFARYGYRYAFHSYLQPVREQIRAPDAKILPDWWMRPQDDFEEWPVILELDKPIQALAFYLRTAVVVLPWIGKVPIPYDALADASRPDTGVQITGSPRGWPRGMEMILDLQDPL